MDLRLLVLVLFLCALAITTTEGGIPKCCMKVSKTFPRSLLKKVKTFDVQTKNGACDIDALVLHVNGKKYCADLKVKRILKKMERRKINKKKV